MYFRLALCVLFAFSLEAGAQDINLSGVVSNSTGKAIAGAIVSLARQGLKDTSGTDGAYSISVKTSVVSPIALVPQRCTILIENGCLQLSLPDPSPLTIEIFDVRGNLLKKEYVPNAPRGFYRFDLEASARSTGLLIVKTAIGQEMSTFRYLPLRGDDIFSAQLSNGRTSRSPAGGALSKLAAISDTIKATAAGYAAYAKTITSYNQVLNITLDTAGNGGAQPSAGCGKEPPFTGEKRVTVNVPTASTGNRDYILRLPADYDKNHPYPLFFEPHCMSGSADNVAHSEPDTKAEYEYLGLWKFANPTNGKGTTIFCAPEGIGAAWGQGAKDLAFFRYMINKFETELCIDKSRIFSIGFSMGGSMSYALACAMPDTMRAIGMLSGGGMSGCDGAKRGPVPIFITHGTQDSRCTWPGNGWPQLQDLSGRDGCTAMDIPTLVSQNPPVDQMHPVCFEYKNCKTGFPCRACIFKGDHIGSPGTLGSYGKNNTWTDDSAWSYFKRYY